MYTLYNDQIRVTDISNKCSDMEGLTYCPGWSVMPVIKGSSCFYFSNASHNNMFIIPLSHFFIFFPVSKRAGSASRAELLSGSHKGREVQTPCFQSTLQFTGRSEETQGKTGRKRAIHCITFSSGLCAQFCPEKNFTGLYPLPSLPFPK